jgi:hypothetical protein
MALLYVYGTGSITKSSRYDAIDDLLFNIPNNTTNSITAEFVRDAVFTLWERVSDLSAIVASASATPTTFMNPEPTTIAVGGIGVNSTFPTPHTVQEMFNLLLYPYTAPVISLSQNITKEYGQTLTHNLIWSVTKKSNPILSVVVDGFTILTILPNQLVQTGTRNVIGTYSSTSGSFQVSTTNIFTMQVNDGAITSTSATITWMNKIYWGSIDLSGLPLYPNPNLTLNPGYVSQVTAIINSNLIRNLATGVGAGAGVGSGSELSITKNKTYNGINGNGKYLIFAWPSSVIGATIPTFYVGGFLVNLFTKIPTLAFTNQWGETTNYEVWVSNTAYNSPTNIIIS